MTKVDYAKRSIQGFAIIFAMTIIGAFLGYVFRIIMARNLTVAEYGAFYAVFSLLSLLFMFRDFGFGQAVIKFIPEFISRKTTKNIQPAVLMLFLFTFIISSLIFFITILFSDFLASHYLKFEGGLFFLILFSALFIFTSLEASLANLFTAFQKHALYSLFQFSRQFLLAIFTLIFFFFWSGLLVPLFAYFTTSLVVLLTFLIILFYTQKEYFKRKWFVFETKLFRKLFFFGLPIIFVSIGGYILQFTDTIMITIFKTTTEVGIYNAALPISNLLLYIGTALITVTMPLASELWAKKKLEAMRQGINLIYKYSFLVILPGIFIVFAYSSMILDLLFGAEFVPAYLALRILVIGSLFFLIAHVNFSIFSGIGMPHVVAKMTLAGAIVNILLNLFLVPLLGFLGAAITTAFCYMLMAVISAYHLRKQISLHIPFGYLLKCLAVSTAFMVIVFFLRDVLDIRFALVEAGIVLSISGVLYLFICFMFRLIDISEIKDIVKKIGFLR